MLTQLILGLIIFAFVMLYIYLRKVTRHNEKNLPTVSEDVNLPATEEDVNLPEKDN